ncbi:proteolipid protein 2b [Amia ocellicauda]|uniref:proteolipid protein 2b n=1 Tax=Amia ocellicauda TaxID=2972642 RepID=UPI003463E031
MADTDADSPSGNVMERLKSYIRTRKGALLAAEIGICLVVLICYAASSYGGYSAVAICEMIFAIIFFVIFMMEFDKQFAAISWPWSDFFRAIIGAGLFLITSLISVIGGGDGARIAGGVFGLIAGILFAYDSYLGYLAIKASKQHHATATSDPESGD